MEEAPRDDANPYAQFQRVIFKYDDGSADALEVGGVITRPVRREGRDVMQLTLVCIKKNNPAAVAGRVVYIYYKETEQFKRHIESTVASVDGFNRVDVGDALWHILLP